MEEFTFEKNYRFGIKRERLSKRCMLLLTSSLQMKNTAYATN